MKNKKKGILVVVHDQLGRMGQNSFHPREIYDHVDTRKYENRNWIDFDRDGQSDKIKQYENMGWEITHIYLFP